METFLIRALQLILCFSLLIILHEGGHFFFAKLFKVRVEKFCLFFDPWFSLFKFKPKKSATTYCLGWLPLGGYVKIAGMIDESMDKEQMKQPVQPWEFRAKPAWQRLLIMIGGVLVNFLLALFIYAMILFTWGDNYVALKDVHTGMKFNESAQQIGFRDGDILLRTDLGELKRFDSNESVGNVYRDLSEAKTVTVLRQGKEVTIQMPPAMNMLEMFKENPPFVDILAPSVIDSVIAGSPASKAGIVKGDRLLGLNGVSFTTWNEFNYQLQTLYQQLSMVKTAADSLKFRQATVVVEHANLARDTLSLVLSPDLKMGVSRYSPLLTCKKTVVTYGFLESFPAGISHGWEVLKGYVNDMKYLFTKDGAQSIGSFGTIGSLFPPHWEWMRFWELTAFISLILAFMNILPIPALDGGHVLFLIYEIIARRKPSEKFMENAQMGGMAFLFLLMGWAILNDLIKYVF